MKNFLVLLLLFSISTFAQDTVHHDQGDMTQYSADVDSRGDKAMGFDHSKTTHHFLMSKDGGSINVTANSAKDKTSIEEIRKHMQHIARLFADGNFEIPMFVHDRVPPGVTTMKRLKSKIQYFYQPVKSGASVIIKSGNPDAITGIHEFLKFQIEDHGTGDSVQMPR
jgi:hypothetical protein